MEIEEMTLEEIAAHVEERQQEAHHRRQRRVYCGEREDTTDGDSHIEQNGGIFRGQRAGGREY